MRFVVVSLSLCLAFSAQAAPPILAHCGGCGTGDTAAKSDHMHNKKASVGHTAPSFKLKDMNGKTHSLAQYKGKTVVEARLQICSCFLPRFLCRFITIFVHDKSQKRFF